MLLHGLLQLWIFNQLTNNNLQFTQKYNVQMNCKTEQRYCYCSNGYYEPFFPRANTYLTNFWYSIMMFHQNYAARCEIRNYRANLAGLHSLPFSRIWWRRLRNKPTENHETSAQDLRHPEEVVTAYCAWGEHSKWAARRGEGNAIFY